MVKADSPNMAMLRDVVARLEPLLPRLVFLGGIVTELLVTEPIAPPARVTADVDVVIDILHFGDYFNSFREELVTLRLEEDTREGAPRCRWRFLDAPRQIVDIMPTKGDILGFSTRWYSDAYAAATLFQLPGGPAIRLVTPPYFLATKLTAFGDRGRRDPISSHDLEDVIAVVDGRESLFAEIQASPTEVRHFISSSWRELLETGNVPALLEAHLPPDAASQARAGLVLERIEAMARLG
jgi:predicted nucleotidyltransferase